jgi:hypothetical protein
MKGRRQVACLWRDAAVGREHNVELNVQLALDEGVLVHRHALVVYGLDVTWLDNLTRLGSA